MDEMLAKHHVAAQFLGLPAGQNGLCCESLTAIGLTQQYLTRQPMVAFRAGKVPIRQDIATKSGYRPCIEYLFPLPTTLTYL